MGHARYKVEVGVPMDPALDEWIEDRAVILNVKKTHLIRDVLALYATLVREAEAEAQIDYGIRNAAIVVPERSEGYKAALTPGGFSRTHLDDSPLGLEEIDEL